MDPLYLPRKNEKSLEEEHVSSIKNMPLAEWLPTQKAAKYLMF